MRWLRHQWWAMLSRLTWPIVPALERSSSRGILMRHGTWRTSVLQSVLRLYMWTERHRDLSARRLR